jgi:hypothetical protein
MRMSIVKKLVCNTTLLHTVIYQKLCALVWPIRDKKYAHDNENFLRYALIFVVILITIVILISVIILISVVIALSLIKRCK